MRCYQACMRPCTRNPQDDACSYKDAPTLSSRVRALELLASSLEARLQELERSHVRSGPSSQVVLPMETTHGRMLSLEYSFAQMEERVQNLGSNDTSVKLYKPYPQPSQPSSPIGNHHLINTRIPRATDTFIPHLITTIRILAIFPPPQSREEAGAVATPPFPGSTESVARPIKFDHLWDRNPGHLGGKISHSQGFNLARNSPKLPRVSVPKMVGFNRSRDRFGRPWEWRGCPQLYLRSSKF
ncbi:hypothetical protein B0H11DRAFT_1901303 [Mycena galericulata]|nr:hypothetical protein B0H11DRAFT_1901303 [Mycena galericulata]